MTKKGICPGCDARGALGDACSERACRKRKYHFIPHDYWDNSNKLAEGPDPMLGQFVGDFLLVERIGAGGFGKIFLGLQAPLFQLKGAVKLIELDHYDDDITEALLEKFKGEAQALAQLSHPNIVKLLKYGVHRQRPYLVMEFVDDGRTLAEDIYHKRLDKAQITLDFILSVVTQMLHALEVAHANNIIHRDIKPDNLMLQDIVGNDNFVRVLDFGLAKFVERGDTTQLALGTPQYMAPEQLNLKNIGPWTDLYAVGVICFWLLTGQRPFPGETQDEIINSKLDKHFDPLASLREREPPEPVMFFLERAMAYEASARYQDTTSFARGLQRAIDALRELEKRGLAEASTIDARPALPADASHLVVTSMHILFSQPVSTMDFTEPTPAPVDPAPSPRAPAPPAPPEQTSQSKPTSNTNRTAIGIIVVLGLIGLGVGLVIEPWADKTKPKEKTDQKTIAKTSPKTPTQTPPTPIEPVTLTPEQQQAYQHAKANIQGAIASGLRHLQWQKLPRPQKVVAGKFHTCALLQKGKLLCWGANQKGELGHPKLDGLGHQPDAMTWPIVSIDDTLTDVAVAGDRNASHTCVINTSGQVRCWGANAFGQLGLGHTRDVGDDEAIASSQYVALAGPAKMIKLGASAYGSHTCALLQNGQVQCWGQNKYGQLGLGHQDKIGDDESPVKPIRLGRKAIAITVGKYHTCALRSDKLVYCWGWNDRGQLGLGHRDNIGDDEPVLNKGKVPLPKSMAPVKDISAGRMHTCALTEKGKVYCWGWNNKGQLGLGHRRDVAKNEQDHTFTPVALPEPATAISTGDLHTCALGRSGKLYCWGDNKFGQLGLGHGKNIGDNELPKTKGLVPLGGPAAQISAGSYHTCAKLRGGQMRCWGLNSTGQLGLGHTKTIGDDETPRQTPSILWTPTKS